MVQYGIVFQIPLYEKGIGLRHFDGCTGTDENLRLCAGCDYAQEQY
jgi:hypothetical protein